MFGKQYSSLARKQVSEFDASLAQPFQCDDTLQPIREDIFRRHGEGPFTNSIPRGHDICAASFLLRA
jgi:hypothetical protein